MIFVHFCLKCPKTSPRLIFVKIRHPTPFRVLADLGVPSGTHPATQPALPPSLPEISLSPFLTPPPLPSPHFPHFPPRERIYMPSEPQNPSAGPSPLFPLKMAFFGHPRGPPLPKGKNPKFEKNGFLAIFPDFALF